MRAKVAHLYEFSNFMNQNFKSKKYRNNIILTGENWKVDLETCAGEWERNRYAADARVTLCRPKDSL